MVATLDLQLVKLLRGAMRAADAHGCSPCGVTAGGIGPRRRIEPTPLIEPRRRIEPTPYIEPRMVIHPRARVESSEPPCPPEKLHTPFPPPWKIRPTLPPITPAGKVKLVVRKTDVPRKATMIDMFI